MQALHRLTGAGSGKQPPAAFPADPPLSAVDRVDLSLEHARGAAKDSLSRVNGAARDGLSSLNGAVGAHVAAGMLLGVADLPENHEADAPWLRGALYVVYPSTEGKATLQRQNGETHPQGYDVPLAAVVDNRVVLLTEGIGDNIPGYARQTYELFQSNSRTGSVDLGQPILVVHEGTEGKTSRDVKRIARDGAFAKRLELGRKIDAGKVYENDPAVKTLVDVIGQQLDQGHDLLLVPHSGGGAENAMALHLLAQQGYRDKIHDHVRVLSLAGAAAPQDYVLAGVAEENVYHTGNHQDGIAQVGGVFIDPQHPTTWAHAARVVVSHAREKTPRHHNELIFEDNVRDGHNYIQEFIEGGEGGIRIW